MWLILIVAAHPESALIPPQRRSVEPLVHAPEPVQSARERGIGVVYDAVFKHERAHAGRLARECRPVGTCRCGNLRLHFWRLLGRACRESAFAVVVHGGSRTLLLLGEGDIEVVIEIAL